MNGRKKPILHLKDWHTEDGKPTAVVHTTTRNKSFVRMCSLLKAMGIKNHLFHMSLMDPDLLYVHPEKLNDSNDPDMKLRMKVMRECWYNPWYFFREICRIPAQGGNPIPFELHRGNLSMLWCFLSHLDITVTQPRQTGKSICAVALCCYILYIAGYNMHIGMLTLNNKILQANVKRLKDIRDALPKYLLCMSTKDIDNKEGLEYARLQNKYLTYTGQKGEADAQNVGRGATSPFLHVDEGPFIPNIHITLPVIMASTNKARATAKEQGAYYTNIFTTTAGDPTQTEGRYMKEYIDKAMAFTEKLYDTVDEEAAHQIVTSNSKNGLINATFSYLQLGHDHAWLEDQVSRSNSSKSQIDRDFLNKWVSHAENPILSKAITDKMYESRRDEPEYVEVWGDYVVNWYAPRDEVQKGIWKEKPFILGFDSSEMSGRDYTTAVGVDPTTLQTLCTFRCNDSNITILSSFISDFLVAYKKCLWVPERKSSGSSIVDYVILRLRKAGQNPFRRIFNRIVQNKHLSEYGKYDIDNPVLNDQSSTRKLLGFMTTGQSRPFLYQNILQKAAENACSKVYDPPLIAELVSLQYKNGRIDHSQRGHDDMVMAWLFANYVIFEGKNLGYYGVDILSILKEVKGSKNDNTYIERQTELKERIKEKLSEVRMASHIYTKRRKVDELEKLVRHYDPNLTISSVNPDSLHKEDFDISSIKNEIIEIKKEISNTNIFQGQGHGLYSSTLRYP